MLFWFALDAKAPADKKEEKRAKLVRAFTVTPGYMERAFNSNEAMIHGPLSLMQLSTKLGDMFVDYIVTPFDDKDSTEWISAEKASAVVKFLYLFLYSGPHEHFARINSIVYHEFGHARAKSSLNIPYHYNAYSEKKAETNYAYGIYISRFFNFLKWSEGAYTKPIWKDSDLNVDNFEKWDEANRFYWDYKRGDLLYSDMAGLNNEMRLAQSIADIIFHKNGHILYAVDYVMNKLGAFHYS
ncbi:MAG: hypothetical protein H6850_00980 [Alphaproteobacteria bacterium]|nr:MAG: hypothetical protein H6850_00980 [Alphaproteobacteria bacterium]